jgi:pimeloyl-ACP methyl ester carboxylesterase
VVGVQPATSQDDDAEIDLDELGPVPPPNVESVVLLGGGRALGYAEFGDPDGDVLLWFHGTPGARNQVPPDIIDEAKPRGFRVITIERPGTGLSTPYEYRKAIDWADDVARFADALHIDTFATAGLSGGGPYVLAVCAAMPSRVRAGAVLGGIGPTRGPERAPGYTKLLPLLEPLLRPLRVPLGEVITHALRPVLAAGSQAYDIYARVAPPSDRPVMARPEMKAMFLNDLVTAAAGGLRAPVGDLVVFARDWGFSLHDITVPVRFWHGDADGIVPFSHGQFQAAMVPGAVLVVCPGAGHFGGFVQTAAVLDWISEVWTDRSHAE